jgi:sorbose reductase
MASEDTRIDTTTTVTSRPDPDTFLKHTVHDLLSLHGRTVVITGGARGLGLAFGFAVAEVGGNVAVIDYLDKPHEHFYRLEKDFGVKVKLYKYAYVCKLMK